MSKSHENKADVSSNVLLEKTVFCHVKHILLGI